MNRLHILKGCFYYTIGNIRPIYRSHLRTIQLLAIAKTHDIRAYGFDSLLQQFVAQINQLASVSFHIFLKHYYIPLLSICIVYTSNYNLSLDHYCSETQ